MLVNNNNDDNDKADQKILEFNYKLNTVIKLFSRFKFLTQYI